jgi:hypothetical protein
MPRQRADVVAVLQLLQVGRIGVHEGDVVIFSDPAGGQAGACLACAGNGDLHGGPPVYPGRVTRARDQRNRKYT